MTEEKGLQDIVRAMKTHFRHADLVEAAAATLLSLSIVGMSGHVSIVFIPSFVFAKKWYISQMPANTFFLQKHLS